MSRDTEGRTRALNDQLRQNFEYGKAFITPGIAALGPEAVQRLIRTIAVFEEFCLASDPYGEHDFGVLDFDGIDVFFKIDYYDKRLTVGSPNPADPTVTERVITVMLASEY